MREALRKVRPTEFEDLVALNALYRPGAMQLHRHLRAQQAEPRGRHLPRRAPAPYDRVHLLARSCYQEQSMQIAKGLAGFSGPRSGRPAQGDRQEGRRPMALAARGVLQRAPAPPARSEQVIEQLWAVNEAAADYSFNKSHAACYGPISYRTAWLKANYTAEYMAALISSVMSTKDKVPFFVSALRGDGDRGAAAGRQRVRARLHRRRAATSASASTP